MPGEADALYVVARRVLLDALTALGGHHDALVLVGAQAIYLHAGDADLAVSPFTSDGDLAIDPSVLQPEPALGASLEAAGFERTDVGIWSKTELAEDVRAIVTVDLLVPESVGGEGRRGARLGGHGNHVARKVRGLEASLVDKTVMSVASLEPTSDGRNFAVAVAGPAALIVAKLHKIADRAGSRREKPKDALDVLRLLRAVPTATLRERMEVILRDPKSEASARDAVTYLNELFSRPQSAGSRMAAEAAAPLEERETITASCAALATDLLQSLGV